MSERDENMATWESRIKKAETGDLPPKGNAAPPPPPRRTAPLPKHGNEALARQAVDKLVALNKGISLAFLSLGMPGTALGISAGEDAFREMAYEALSTDAELCRTINRMGAASGKFGLMMAYTGLAISVAGTTKEEIKNHPMREYLEKKRAERGN